MMGNSCGPRPLKPAGLGKYTRIKKESQPSLKFRLVKAERAGFEPAIELPLYTLSRRAPSATRTPLHEGRQKYNLAPELAESKWTLSLPPKL